ncbi:MAG: 1-acyl-sn-glycerol-3-phosphate acyltransferase [Anaerolineae bacterium]|jgi:1-acyl-sn-glycerol-3-phosphate acyltransferase|nr:1-acyl-sn-glycerol-3-phosphate acyltransferase [Anaerolineae bacterium]PKN96325.1 MAG: 1-acyl-sn-glycerol-3-phosphate acyltransferase [Chloroflexi bacterium HGW-Chloroflexi-5]
MTLASTIINPPIKAILSTILKVDDSEVMRIPMQGPLILATNHINSLDAPVGFSYLHPRPVTAFVKVETWNNFLMKWLFNAWEAIPIKRGEVDFEAFRLADEALKQKKIIIVAPEGTRSYHGRLNKGYPGIVMLAIRSGVPILPVVFFGNENMKIKLAKRIHMTIKVGEPFKIDTKGAAFSKEVRTQVTDEIMYEIAALLPEKNRGVYGDLSLNKREYLNFSK